MPSGAMDERYDPSSDFLCAVIAGDVTLFEGEFGAVNLALLIALTEDGDSANREWAVTLLSRLEVDTDEVRAALLRAVTDSDKDVRAEAMLGLAQRDPALALPYVRAELAGDYAALPVFEAATLVADRSLLRDLRAFASGPLESDVDSAIRTAIEACEKVPRRKIIRKPPR